MPTTTKTETKAQRDWRAQKQRISQSRQALIEVLGGQCAWCGDDDDLQIDHINGRDYSLRAMSWAQRIARYWAEYREGKIQVLCGACNHGKHYGTVRKEDFQPF